MTTAQMILFLCFGFCITLGLLFSESTLGNNPTPQQRKNRRKFKKFVRGLFRGNSDPFMEIQFFMIGLGFLILTVYFAIYIY